MCNCTWEISLNVLSSGTLFFPFTCPQGINIIPFSLPPLPKCPLGMTGYCCFVVCCFFFSPGYFINESFSPILPRSSFTIQLLWNTSMKIGSSIMGDTPPRAFCLWYLHSTYAMRSVFAFMDKKSGHFTLKWQELALATQPLFPSFHFLYHLLLQTDAESSVTCWQWFFSCQQVVGFKTLLGEM